MSSTFVFIKFGARNDQFKLYTNILYYFACKQFVIAIITRYFLAENL